MCKNANSDINATGAHPTHRSIAYSLQVMPGRRLCCDAASINCRRQWGNSLENWDDIRFFLAVARQGGLTSAANQLGINHTTVARRLTNLETSLRTRLVTRTPTGVTLTPAGQKFVQHAERIELEALSAEQEVCSVDGM